MSAASDAVQILIAAEDDASDKFGAVGDAAERFRARLDSLNEVLSARGLAKAAPAIAELATKLTVAGIAAKTLQLAGEGAAEVFKSDFAGGMANINSLLSTAQDLVKGFGRSLAEAFSDSNLGSNFKKWLETLGGGAPGGGGQDLPFDRKLGGDTMGGLLGRKKALIDEHQSLSGVGSLLSPRAIRRKSEIDEELRNINREITSRQQGGKSEIARGIFGGFQTNTPQEQQRTAARRALSAALAGGKTVGESPYTTQFGTPKSIIEGIAGAAKKKQRDAEDKQLEIEAKRQRIIEETLTPQERFNERMAELKNLFPQGGEVFNRAAKQAAEQRDNLLNRGLDKSSPSTHLQDNAAIVSRFGGGVVRGDPMLLTLQKQLAAQEDMKKRIQDAVKFLPRDAEVSRARAVNSVKAGLLD